MDCDFCGWATKNNVRCTDGLTILQNAFQGNDGAEVPLVWMHDHSDPTNTLGHAYLENREEGVYAYGYFNNTPKAMHAKECVMNGDVQSLSIFAGGVKKNGNYVMHGDIKEVSLVLAGANPEARIENVIAHSDEDSEWEECNLYLSMGNGIGFIKHSDEVEKKNDKPESEKTVGDIVATMNEEQKRAMYFLIDQVMKGNIKHSDDSLEDSDEEETVSHSDGSKNEKTVQDVVDSMTEEQKKVMYFIIGMAVKDAKKNGGKDNMEVKHNVFEGDQDIYEGACISHADQTMILDNAKKTSCGSFKAALKEYMESNDISEDEIAHGFNPEQITQLFPDDKLLNPGAPEIIPENDAWVTTWMNKTHKSPFPRVRTRQADISKIRASGYAKKGNKKVNIGNIELVGRVTHPQTVYIKDELHRDDILDIEDFDIVSYEHNVMRGKLDTELARASLFGDGREPGDEQKINEENIRPVWTDDELYTIHKTIDIDGMKSKLQGTNTGANFGEEFIKAEATIAAFRHALEEYKGSGNLDAFMSTSLLNDMMLARDMNGRRIYDTEADLAKALHVRSIVECDEIKGLVRTSNAEADRGTQYDLQALFINPNDYNYGATRGGQVSNFNDFDIDFNKYKYLIETRLSGALTRVKSAIVLETAHAV